jgi:hypothetical protein
MYRLVVKINMINKELASRQYLISYFLVHWKRSPSAVSIDFLCNELWRYSRRLSDDDMYVVRRSALRVRKLWCGSSNSFNEL